MKRSTVKKGLKYMSIAMLFFVAVLVVHIYIATRPKAPTVHTVAMARLDIKQHIDQQGADRVTGWLSQQKGVDHVLCNVESNIVVFTFRPFQTSANNIVAAFKKQLPYKVERYVPTQEEMQRGCPVATTSLTYRVYQFFRSNF